VLHSVLTQCRACLVRLLAESLWTLAAQTCSAHPVSASSGRSDTSWQTICCCCVTFGHSRRQRSPMCRLSAASPAVMQGWPVLRMTSGGVRPFAQAPSQTGKIRSCKKSRARRCAATWAACRRPCCSTSTCAFRDFRGNVMPALNLSERMLSSACTCRGRWSL